MTDRRIFAAPFSNPLAGEWTDAADAVETFDALRERYGDTDILIADHEGFGSLSELASPEDVVTIDAALEEHGEAFAAWRKFHGHTGEADDVDAFEEAYRGHFLDDEDFAMEYAERTGLLDDAPEIAARYFDYATFARDLMMDHYSEGGFYFTAL